MKLDDEHGFTLIEAIVALAIASVALTVFYSALSDSFHQKIRISERATAATEAVYHLRKFELEGQLPESEASHSERDKNPFVWQHQFTPVAGIQPGTTSQSKILSLAAKNLDDQTVFELNALVRQR